MKVLGIDDSSIVRDILHLALHQAGIRTILASDGLEGLKALDMHRPDIVITDANMPELDGYEFIERVRARPEFTGLPIFLLTTAGAGDPGARARASGATGWIEKPFSPPVLLDMLRAYNA